MKQQPTIADIIRAIETAFPPHYQEDFDNTGLQVGDVNRPCTGVMLCVDVTPAILAEAADKKCNLIISHHPLIFRGLKRIASEGRVEASVVEAIRRDIAVYSCHTSVDNTPRLGVSWRIAEMLGLTDVEPLEAHGPDGIGCGVVGNLPEALTPQQLVDKVKATFGSPIARCSTPEGVGPIKRLGLCGGAGSFLIPTAIAKGAEAFLTSDCKFNLFLDYVGQIFLIDIGHYESEMCTRRIFHDLLVAEFPECPVYMSAQDINPIHYL